MVRKLYKRLGKLMMVLSVLAFAGYTSASSTSSISPMLSEGVKPEPTKQLLTGLPPLHPIFVSVTDMNYNQKDKTMEISCKIFTDDLETVLAKATGLKIDLFNPKDTALTGKQISNYISTHLILKIDGKPVHLNFIGFERELDAVWSYFEISQVGTAPKNIAVMNDLLYDNFKQQINLMHVTVAGNRKSTKLDNPDSSFNFSF